MRQIFDSVQIGELTLTNKIALAPLTRSCAQGGGIPAAIS